MVLFDNIKELCEKKGVSVWKLEKDLDFSNRSTASGTRQIQAFARFRKWPIILVLQSKICGVGGETLEKKENECMVKISVDTTELDLALEKTETACSIDGKTAEVSCFVF